MQRQTPLHVVLIALLTGSVTAVLSIAYLILCVIALVFRTQCVVEDLESINGSQYFVNVMYRLYIQNAECETSLDGEGLTVTQPYTVFVMICVTLAASLFCLCASVTLVIGVRSKWPSGYLALVVYIYTGLYAVSLVVDITFATHFGVDYIYISDQLDSSASTDIAMNYIRDTSRLGAFLLMTVALKGYVAHVINIVLICLLLHYLTQFTAQDAEHSIHKLGALNGYGTNNTSYLAPQKLVKRDSITSDSYASNVMNGSQLQPQVNPMFINDEDLSQGTATMNARHPHNKADYLRQESSRSWQLGVAGNAESRPFSYLQEQRRGGNDSRLVPVRPPVAPAPANANDDVRRKWNTPMPIPAPDYSPYNQRRAQAQYM